MPKQSCKTCAHMVVLPDADGVRRVRRGRMYRCDCPVVMPEWPDSVLRHYEYKWPPAKRMMEGSDGEECRTWKDRTVEDESNVQRRPEDDVASAEQEPTGGEATTEVG